MNFSRTFLIVKTSDNFLWLGQGQVLFAFLNDLEGTPGLIALMTASINSEFFFFVFLCQGSIYLSNQ